MPQDLDKIRQIKQAAEVDLLRRPGVTGVDIGYKYVGGMKTDEIVIRVHVAEKKDVPPDQKIPDTINGVKTDVLQNRFLPAVDSGMYTPVLGGIEISSSRIIVGGVGTLGAIVVDNTSKDVLMLSNYHVLCGNDFNWHEGDPIAQPQLILGGKFVGRLVNGILDEGDQTDPSKVGLDVAVARFNSGPLLGDRGHINRIVDIGPVTGTAKASWNSAVRKRGRTTGLTFGHVSGLEATYPFDYGGKIGSKTLYHQISILADGEHNERFMDKGDSGSVVVDSAGQVIGLLFGMSEDGRLGLACPIEAVLSKLNASMAVCLPPPISASTRLTSCVLSGDRPRVYYLDPHDHVMELGWFTFKPEPGFGVHLDYWYGTDVTARAKAVDGSSNKAPLPLSTTPLTSCVLTGDRPRVYWLDQNCHLVELDWSGGSDPDWYWTDVTANAKALDGSSNKAPLPLSTTPLTSCVVSGDQPRVHWLDQNCHVVELGWTGGSDAHWYWTDVTARAKAVDGSSNKAPLPLSTTPLTSCVLTGDRPRIYWLDQNCHVVEFDWSGGSDADWYWTDVTANAKALDGSSNKAPLPLSTTPLTSCVVSGDQPRVHWLDQNCHVVELGWTGGSDAHWYWTDVTARAKAVDGSSNKAPLPLSTTPLTSCVLTGDRPRVYWLDQNCHVVELDWSGDWYWTDVTANAKDEQIGQPLRPPNPTTPLTSCVVSGDRPRVYLLDQNNCVTELWWSGDHWCGFEIYVDQ